MEVKGLGFKPFKYLGNEYTVTHAEIYATTESSVQKCLQRDIEETSITDHTSRSTEVSEVVVIPTTAINLQRN